MSSTTLNDESGYYVSEVDNSTYSTIIFCRMNPNTTDNNWDNRWNQSADIPMPTADALYDMSGNCYEFCEDNLVENPILNGSKNPIVRTTPKGFRIVRNTPFDSYVISVGDRNWCPCDRRQNGYGFRLAL